MFDLLILHRLPIGVACCLAALALYAASRFDGRPLVNVPLVKIAPRRNGQNELSGLHQVLEENCEKVCGNFPYRHSY